MEIVSLPEKKVAAAVKKYTEADIKAFSNAF